MIKAFVITLCIFLGFAVFIFFRTGLNQPVNLMSGEVGPYLLVYKIHRGSYHKMNSTIESVETFFKEKNKSCPMAFGRYIHDPSLVDEDRLESHGGCVFVSQDDQVKNLIQENSELQSEWIEKKEYIIATFEGSPSVGPIKVYPEVESWMKKYGYKKKGPVIEIYQTLGADAVMTKYLFDYE